MPDHDPNLHARAELRAMGATFRRCVDGTRHLTKGTAYKPWPPNGNARTGSQGPAAAPSVR
jgi:hypothetical protein